MTPSATELAFRTAATAGPFADSLASDVVGIAHALRVGELDPAFEAFETSAHRLQRFLTFLVVTSELLAGQHPTLGAVVADYCRRLLDIVQRIDRALESSDLVGLTLALEHGLARALTDYAGYEGEVRRAFESAPLAA